MKKTTLVCLLAAQIMAACAQSPKGSNNFERLDQANNKLEQLSQEFESLYEKAQANPTPELAAQMEALGQQGDSLLQAQIELTIATAKEQKNNKRMAKYIAHVSPYMTMEQLEAVCDPQAAYYNEPTMTQTKKTLASMKLRQTGTTYRDLTMNDPEGRTVKLSQWVGKGYVLVDFWASWCGPCRAEMPNVVESYKRYHDRGYEIVGVSFDQKKDAWTEAIGKLGMTWPQMSDLKGWDCAASEVYGVNSIPSNILIDPQGKIVASDLRGEELLNKLAEIYK